MQKTFKLVRENKLTEVKNILDNNPNEINAVAKQPPKKDDGQSLLQVAIKSGNIEMANLLLDYHADVNFMESSSCCNEWRIPVIHDAIRRAIMDSRWNIIDYDGKIEVHSSKERAAQSYQLLKRMLELGADVKAKDSYGNCCLTRAVLDARQILPSYNYTTNTLGDDRKLTRVLRKDLHRIFDLLFEYGVESTWLDRTSGRPIIEQYCQEPVFEFLK